jgi:hypothetical protein
MTVVIEKDKQRRYTKDLISVNTRVGDLVGLNKCIDLSQHYIGDSRRHIIFRHGFESRIECPEISLKYWIFFPP